MFRSCLLIFASACVIYQIIGIQRLGTVWVDDPFQWTQSNDELHRDDSLDSDDKAVRSIDLDDLRSTHPEESCPGNLMLVEDHIPENRLSNLTIPPIIHITSKSRCVTKSFAQNIRKWQDWSPNYSFIFHNDAAMERLLEKSWPQFPHLQQALHCTLSGAARADVWRALVVWEYGGIYTDMDNAPGPFFTESVLRDEEAFFVVEREGFLSQYFFAARPRHPLMFLLIQCILHRLMDLNDVENQYVPFVTGPGALKTAFAHFMQVQVQNLPRRRQQQVDVYATFQKVRAGLYHNFGTSVRVVGTRKTSEADWIHRNVLFGKKRLYLAMNMTHFGAIPRRISNESCWQRVMSVEMKNLQSPVARRSS